MHEASIVIGSEGMIGRSICTYLERQGQHVFKTSRHVRPGVHLFDLNGNPEQVGITTGCYGAAYICAAITGIEKCKQFSAVSHAVNVIGTLRLIDYLEHLGIFTVILSSDMVIGSQSTYAVHKREVEQAVAGRNIAVARLGKVLTKDSGLLFNWVQMLIKGITVTPFNNYYFAPLGIDNAVHGISELARLKQHGITLLAGTPPISYADALLYIAEKLNLDKSLIKPTPAAETNYLHYVSAPSTPYISWNELDWFCT